MRANTTGKVGAAVLAVLLVAGCGSSRSGEDTGASGGGDDGGGGGSSAESFGELESPCGEGDASGATDQGVTDDQITIGWGDDRGFTASPGLSEDVGDAMDAMVAWCNEQGGINGRQIGGTRYDAAIMNTASVVQQACTTDFMLVGQGFALDESAEQFRVGCELPTVPAFTVGSNAGMGPLKYEAMPFPVDLYNSSGLELIIDEVPGFASGPTPIFTDTPSTAAATEKVMQALQTLGVEPVDCNISLSQLGEANYVPFAERYRDCGGEAMWTSLSPGASMFGLIEALDRTGQDVQIVGESNWYGDVASDYNEQSGGLLDGMVTQIYFQPFENADLVPAVQQYLDILEESGGKSSLLGMQATSSFLLWATAAKDCGSDLTRECVLENLSEVHEWTGGGLHAPTDPGGNRPSECALIVQLEGTEWSQIAPEERGEFSCDPENVIESDPAIAGVTLNEDRISTAFLQ